MAFINIKYTLVPMTQTDSKFVKSAYSSFKHYE
jgi:hypothetical protein